MSRKNIIYFVVTLIGILLLTDILLTKYNNTTITENEAVRRQINIIKIYYDQVGKVVIHSLDIGLRGYAIVKEEKFSKPMENSLAWKDSIFANIEVPLKQFNYDMTTFNVLKDSVNAYASYCFHLRQLLTENDTPGFIELFKKDKGANLWWQYLLCEKDILDFINAIDQAAMKKVEAAMARNQTLQIILFLICLPTLLYTAYHTAQTFRLSELLRVAEKEKNKILTEQNINLERNVAERTQEILSQNEEIISQSEELATQRDVLFLQNKEVQDAHKLIEIQNREIQYKNESLEREILNQTQELRNTNQELIEQNNQLEQFAFIAAHNLRSPLARILGLANVIELSESEEDRDTSLRKIVASAMDLDAVIKDLTTILDIQKQTGNFSSIDLPAYLDRVVKTLEKECEETNATITIDVASTPMLNAVSPYIESILYNLISNAIKYRDPDRKPIVTIKSTPLQDHILLIISDNGLGIDLSKHGENVFNLYKRFHLHVEGKGLGLFLVKGQMEAMGGKIEIESEVDKGTTFRLYFKR